jgi:hypothetical protein
VLLEVIHALAYMSQGEVPGCVYQSRSGIELGDGAYNSTDTSECCTNFPTSK